MFREALQMAVIVAEMGIDGVKSRERFKQESQPKTIPYSERRRRKIREKIKKKSRIANR